MLVLFVTDTYSQNFAFLKFTDTVPSFGGKIKKKGRNYEVN